MAVGATSHSGPAEPATSCSGTPYVTCLRMVSPKLRGDGAGSCAGFLELVGLETDGGDRRVSAAAVALRDAGQVVPPQLLLPGIRAQRDLAAVRPARDRDRVQRGRIGRVRDELVHVVDAQVGEVVFGDGAVDA